MKHRKCAVAILTCLVLGLAPVYAQTYQAKIPFAFSVGSQLHPAGTYTVAHDKSNPKVLSLRPQTGPGISVAIITRLSPREALKKEAQLVFDEVDGNYTLAELYLPGADGFYVGSVLVEHKHVIINAPQ